jgi:MFS family permease
MTVNGTTSSEPGKSEPLVAPMPGARTALILLLAINLFNYIDRYVLAAVEKQIGHELLPGDPYDSTKMGLLAPAFLVTYMLLSPLFGWLGDRMSRWWLMAVGVILWSLASGASGLASGFWILFATRCFVGVGEAAYGPVAPTVISDYYPVKIRGSVLAWFYAAIPVGSALGYGLGELAENAAGWRWAFYLVVPPGILLGVMCIWMREPIRGQADAGPAGPPRMVRLRDYRILWHIPSYVLNTLGMTAMTFAIGGLAFWMPRYLVEEGHAPPLAGIPPVTAFGGLTALAGLTATLAGGILGDRLRSRFPGSYFIVSGISMLIGFPMVLLVLHAPFPWAWLFIFLAVFTLFFNTGPTNTILANVTPASIRASGFALNILVIHLLGDALSPVIIGLIRNLTPSQTLYPGFVLVSVMMVVGGLLWLWGARYLEEDNRLAPTRLSAE